MTDTVLEPAGYERLSHRSRHVRRHNPVEYLSFRPGAIGQAIRDRGTPAGVAKTMCERYMLLVGRVDCALFTATEAAAVANVLRDYEFDETDLASAEKMGDFLRAELPKVDDLNGLIDIDHVMDRFAWIVEPKAIKYEPTCAMALLDCVAKVHASKGGPDVLIKAGLVRGKAPTSVTKPIRNRK